MLTVFVLHGDIASEYLVPSYVTACGYNTYHGFFNTDMKSGTS